MSFLNLNFSFTAARNFFSFNFLKSLINVAIFHVHKYMFFITKHKFKKIDLIDDRFDRIFCNVNKQQISLKKTIQISLSI